jgi:hypothetical protein
MRDKMIAATLALAALVVGPGSALAAAGAIAYDQGNGKYGLAWNKPTQQEASDAAKKDCGSDNCKLIPVPGGKCAALATGADPKESNNAWGVSIRESKAQAELAAMQNCQKRTSSQCKIRGSECNR